MILDDADKKIRYFNRIGIHYEAVYHYLIKKRHLTPEIFSPQLLDDITAGLISFDMQRMMGRNKYLINGKSSWAFLLLKKLQKHGKTLSALRNYNLQTIDFQDSELINKIISVFEDLSKDDLKSLNISSQEKGFQVGASKILHFLIPDLFIIVDSNAKSELAKNYKFSKYKKIDGNRYVSAIKFYQKELQVWSETQNDKHFSMLIALDPSWKNYGAKRKTPLPRIIDKCTFVGDKKFNAHRNLPEKFYAIIGGYPGSFFKIELYGDTLIYNVYDYNFDLKISKSIDPSNQKWKHFKKVIDELRVWEWNCDYPNPGVMDGTQWAVELQYGEQKIKSRGDNQYPGRNGSSSLEMTNELEGFLHAVSGLIGGLHFY